MENCLTYETNDFMTIKFPEGETIRKFTCLGDTMRIVTNIAIYSLSGDFKLTRIEWVH